MPWRDSIHQCWDEGILTPDLVPGGCGTARVTEAVCERLSSGKNTSSSLSGLTDGKTGMRKS